MIYREAGQFKTSYAADQAIFPILQDRIAVAIMMVVALVVIPMFGSDYFLEIIMINVLFFSLAAIGLNLLTGYTGQISLGTGGFMAVGAVSSYKMAILFPDLNIILIFLLSGLFAAAVGILFGLPSLRIKGFYLAVATLAAQFFLDWLFLRVDWFTNASTAIEGVPRSLFGVTITGPAATPVAKYYVALGFVLVFALIAKNLVRSQVGRAWMAIRDMDIAAEIIGIRPLRTKLLAFAISSFYCGIAGSLMLFLFYDSAEPDLFDINLSFKVLFMIIIGGLGSILGSFLGAAFIVTIPVILTNAPDLLGLPISSELAKHLEFMIFGALIIFFLIVEPHGLARLWQIAKEKLRQWPFPY
ncbi:MAG: branched-chain amino acid ABC transporter permease [Alphaproteobacteria bacterium]|nr:MAG: branched-chain amino acid ABC transporter permease [Alphaproteobacteria bacterium]